MDAIQLLKKDHDAVKKMLETLDETTERAIKTRIEVFTRLEHELRIHETIEEEIFYPELTEHPKTKALALEGYEEHHVVDTIMEEIRSVPVDDERWKAKFSVMKENIEHHIEEEESEMFKQARQVFDKAELEDLGAALEARKQQLSDAGPTQ